MFKAVVWVVFLESEVSNALVPKPTRAIESLGFLHH